MVSWTADNKREQFINFFMVIWAAGARTKSEFRIIQIQSPCCSSASFYLPNIAYILYTILLCIYCTQYLSLFTKAYSFTKMKVCDLGHLFGENFCLGLGFSLSQLWNWAIDHYSSFPGSTEFSKDQDQSKSYFVNICLLAIVQCAFSDSKPMVLIQFGGPLENWMHVDCFLVLFFRKTIYMYDFTG